MKPFTFDVRWNEIKGLLRQRYGQLTDDDLEFAEGKGEEMLARLGGKLGVSADELNSTLDQLGKTVGVRVESATEKVSHYASEVRAKAASTAEDVKQQAGVAYDQARERVRTLQEDGEDYIRQNPRQALVTALFAGFVAGLLLRR